MLYLFVLRELENKEQLSGDFKQGKSRLLGRTAGVKEIIHFAPGPKRRRNKEVPATGACSAAGKALNLDTETQEAAGLLYLDSEYLPGLLFWDWRISRMATDNFSISTCRR